MTNSLSFQVALFGCSHGHVPLATRERVALDRNGRRCARVLLQTSLPGEVAVFSTCNRTEVLVARSQKGEPLAPDVLRQTFLNQIPGAAPLKPDDVDVHVGPAAVLRFFRIATGLESLVFGEIQILTQLRDQFAEAKSEGAAGLILQPLMEAAVACARHVRQSTGLNREARGVPRIAAEYLLNHVGVRGTVAIVGRSELAAQIARRLRMNRPTSLMTVHRCPGKARAFGQHLGARPVTLSHMEDWIGEVDALVAAAPTGLDKAFKPPTQVGRQLKVVLDLAVPRTLDPSWGQCSESTEFHDLETLSETAALPPPNSRTVLAAAALVERESHLFLHHHATRGYGLPPWILAPVRAHSSSLLDAHAKGCLSHEDLVDGILQLALEAVEQHGDRTEPEAQGRTSR